VLAFSAEVTLQGSADRLCLVVPSLLARVLREPNAPAVPARGAAEALLESLASARLDVQAVLRGADIRVRDLLRLQPGMVLELPHKTGTPFDCQLNGVTRLRVEMMRADSGAALVVQSWTGIVPSAAEGSGQRGPAR